MTRSLPAPLAKRPLARYRAGLKPERVATFARVGEALLPLVRHILHESQERKESFTLPHFSEVMEIESLHLSLIEYGDGRREWSLRHLTMKTPRRPLRSGRWLLALPFLGLMALAATRTTRLRRPTPLFFPNEEGEV